MQAVERLTLTVVLAVVVDRAAVVVTAVAPHQVDSVLAVGLSTNNNNIKRCHIEPAATIRCMYSLAVVTIPK